MQKLVKIISLVFDFVKWMGNLTSHLTQRLCIAFPGFTEGSEDVVPVIGGKTILQTMEQ